MIVNHDEGDDNEVVDVDVDVNVDMMLMSGGSESFLNAAKSEEMSPAVVGLEIANR